MLVIPVLRFTLLPYYRLILSHIWTAKIYTRKNSDQGKKTHIGTLFTHLLTKFHVFYFPCYYISWKPMSLTNMKNLLWRIFYHKAGRIFQVIAFMDSSWGNEIRTMKIISKFSDEENWILRLMKYMALKITYRKTVIW